MIDYQIRKQTKNIICPYKVYDPTLMCLTSTARVINIKIMFGYIIYITVQLFFQLFMVYNIQWVKIIVFVQKYIIINALEIFYN